MLLLLLAYARAAGRLVMTRCARCASLRSERGGGGLVVITVMGSHLWPTTCSRRSHPGISVCTTSSLTWPNSSSLCIVCPGPVSAKCMNNRSTHGLLIKKGCSTIDGYAYTSQPLYTTYLNFCWVSNITIIYLSFIFNSKCLILDRVE